MVAIGLIIHNARVLVKLYNVEAVNVIYIGFDTYIR